MIWASHVLLFISLSLWNMENSKYSLHIKLSPFRILIEDRLFYINALNEWILCCSSTMPLVDYWISLLHLYSFFPIKVGILILDNQNMIVWGILDYISIFTLENNMLSSFGHQLSKDSLLEWFKKRTILWFIN